MNSNVVRQRTRLSDGQRLQTTLAAVETVRDPLNTSYGSLTDEQKAQFEMIGRTATKQGSTPLIRTATLVGLLFPARLHVDALAAAIAAAGLVEVNQTESSGQCLKISIS